jgi:ketosteroid isomerase-like protein
MTFHDEINAFFHTYIEAFARRDADAISELWDDVGLFPSPSGNFAMERQAFRAHCSTLLEFYSNQGIVHPTGELLSATELFPHVAQARMVYRMYDAEKQLIATWEHVYVLRRTNKWRVSLTIADGEMAVWTAKGAQL